MVLMATVLSYEPAVLLVTVYTTAQLPFAGMVPPVRVTELAVFVTAPPHCGLAGAPETVSPAGNPSVKVTPVSGVLLRLVKVMVTVLVPPTTIVAGV